MPEPDSAFEIVTKGQGNGTWTVSFRVGTGDEYEFRLSGYYGKDEYPSLVDQLAKALLAIEAAGRRDQLDRDCMALAAWSEWDKLQKLVLLPDLITAIRAAANRTIDSE